MRMKIFGEGIDMIDMIRWCRPVNWEDFGPNTNVVDGILVFLACLPK